MAIVPELVRMHKKREQARLSERNLMIRNNILAGLVAGWAVAQLVRRRESIAKALGSMPRKARLSPRQPAAQYRPAVDAASLQGDVDPEVVRRMAEEMLGDGEGPVGSFFDATDPELFGRPGRAQRNAEFKRRLRTYIFGTPQG